MAATIIGLGFHPRPPSRPSASSSASGVRLRIGAAIAIAVAIATAVAAVVGLRACVRGGKEYTIVRLAQ